MQILIGLKNSRMNINRSLENRKKDMGLGQSFLDNKNQKNVKVGSSQSNYI